MVGVAVVVAPAGKQAPGVSSSVQVAAAARTNIASATARGVTSCGGCTAVSSSATSIVSCEISPDRVHAADTRSAASLFFTGDQAFSQIVIMIWFSGILEKKKNKKTSNCYRKKNGV